MCEIDWAQLCEEVAEYIDLDPMLWMENEGAFNWGAHRVYFVKTDSAVELTIGSETRTCGRL